MEARRSEPKETWRDGSVRSQLSINALQKAVNTYKSAAQGREPQESQLVGVDEMLVHAEGGEYDRGKSCEEPEDVEEGDHFGDERGGFHAILDWVGEVEMGEEGWNAGHVDGLGGVLVVGRVVGAVGQVFFAFWTVFTLWEESVRCQFEKYILEEVLHVAFNSPHNRSGDGRHRTAGYPRSRSWR